MSEATKFFYERCGKRLMDENPSLPLKCRLQDHGVCSICGDEGPVIMDKRQNAWETPYRCIPCWSFVHPVGDLFTDHGNDRSFTGAVNNYWLLEDDGQLRFFLSEDKLEGFHPKIGDVIPTSSPFISLLRASLSATPPFLAGFFGFRKNKKQGIAGLQLTRSLDALAICEVGDVWYCNGARLLRLAEQLSGLEKEITGKLSDFPENERKMVNGLRGWVNGIEPVDRSLLFHQRKAVKFYGLDPTIPSRDRHYAKSFVFPPKPKGKRGKQAA